MNKSLILVFSLFPAFTACAGESVWDRPTSALAQPTEMTVYRSPTCGCCGKWIDHMKKQGFVIKDIQREDMDTLKRELGVPEELQSCHTARVGDYVVEGHVPAADVKKLLTDKPKAIGLAVPGMVTGSPGMEMGGRKDPFEVIVFDRDGKTDKLSTYDKY